MENTTQHKTEETILNTIKIVISQRNYLFTTQIETKKVVDYKKVTKSLAIYLDTKMQNSIKLKNLGIKKCKGSFLFSRSFELSIYTNENIILDSVKFNTMQNEEYKINCKDKETFEAVLNIMLSPANFANIYEGI